MGSKLAKSDSLSPVPKELLNDIRKLIKETRSTVATTVNVGLTMLYWRIGKRINEEILKGERADYGKEILATLSQELTRDYGRGFSYSSLTRMVAFSQAFPDGQIVATLSQQLSWSHFKEILPLKDPLQREFYAAHRDFQEARGTGKERARGITGGGSHVSRSGLPRSVRA